MEIERHLCACCKPVLHRYVRSAAGQGFHIGLRNAGRPAALRLTSSLLATGMPRPEVRAALMVRLQISRRTAYRLISDALQARGPRA